jgi:adenylate cyclase class 2
MPLNLEIKARYAFPEKAVRIAQALGARNCGVLRQTDTYFIAGSNRLKLREMQGKITELIWYQRPDQRGSKYSTYSVKRISNSRSVKRLFSSLFGVQAIVRKRRMLFLFQNSRIHIDVVSGLGTFLEFEILVNKGRRQAGRLMQTLVKEFEVSPKSLVGVSYSDLALRRRKCGTHRV